MWDACGFMVLMYVLHVLSLRYSAWKGEGITGLSRNLKHLTSYFREEVTEAREVSRKDRSTCLEIEGGQSHRQDSIWVKVWTWGKRSGQSLWTAKSGRKVPSCQVTLAEKQWRLPYWWRSLACDSEIIKKCCLLACWRLCTDIEATAGSPYGAAGGGATQWLPQAGQLCPFPPAPSWGGGGGGVAELLDAALSF